MSRHQAIYTSCRRGIKGGGSGFQIYSCDANFGEAARLGADKMFGYNHPDLPAGKVMTDELAPTMPRSFSYALLDNGLSVLAAKNYLGRDYMGKTGRFGNFFNHIIFFVNEEIPGYPAEYYGTLKDGLPGDETNREDAPPPLAAPELTKGSAVTLQTTAEFLSEKGRTKIFAQMLTALLESEEKKILIADEGENIIFWIAALHYAFPENTAHRIPFDTYAYNPPVSKTRICGVVKEGTYYSEGLKERHSVFDFFAPSFPAAVPCAYAEFAAQNLFDRKKMEDFFVFANDTLTEKSLQTPGMNFDNAYKLFCGEKSAELLQFCASDCRADVGRNVAAKILTDLPALVAMDEEAFAPYAEFLKNVSLSSDDEEKINLLYAERLIFALKNGGDIKKALAEAGKNLRRASAAEVLCKNNDFDGLMMLYRYNMRSANDLTAAKKFFNDYQKLCENGCPLDMELGLSEYFRIVNAADFSHCDDKLDFIKFLSDKNLHEDYCGQLLRGIFEEIPLKKPDSKVDELIKKIQPYTERYKYLVKSNKINLIMLGYAMESAVMSFMAAQEVREKVRRCDAGHYDLSAYDKDALKEYLGWIVPLIFKIAQDFEEQKIFYTRFGMTKIGKGFFLEKWADYYIFRIRDYEKFAELFKLLAEERFPVLAYGDAIASLIKKDEAAKLSAVLDELLSDDADLQAKGKAFCAKLNPGLLGKIGGLFRKFVGLSYGRYGFFCL